MDKYKMQSIDRLDISDKAIKMFRENRIETLGDLCSRTKTELREMELKQGGAKVYKLSETEFKQIDSDLGEIGLYLAM